ncbi:MAG: flagellar biosynthesis protein FlhA [Deltaproteobacteria bacterium]|nr:flagellar biosynthesis protein FlhA [Deltaproteobacteria bacterium]
MTANSGLSYRAAISSLVEPGNAVAIVVVAILGVMLVPLPPLVLDLLLATSLGLSLLVFLLSLHIERPLEFSAFSSVLLIVTLFRLALNVASTRIILLHGSDGTDAAGRVIEAFGQLVVGGDAVVGGIVFVILIIINFVVVTKGAGRIAEVAARFTLDAMPGKQMAIDADLAAGALTREEAIERRKTVQSEADFFGSMDGASKFVRGDAIAGLLITGINIVGGFVVGVLRHEMPIEQAAKTYMVLSVGDGLVSQVPALLTSVAAGLVTTRAAAGGALGETVQKQVFGARQPAAIGAAVLGILAVVPGMPHFSFFALAASLGYLAYSLRKAEAVPAEESETEGPEVERMQLAASLPLDVLEVEVGYELVPLVDAREGSLLKRIAGIRKQIAEDLGLVVPPIHVRDSLRLRPSEYRVRCSGGEIGRGDVKVGRLLAINPGDAIADVPGTKFVEPAFGLDALWIASHDRDRAELGGFTVVDPATVIATHLGEVLKSHAHELLGRREVQDLVDIHRADNAKVIEELIPSQLPLAKLVKVLKNLLAERVSIRDFRTILEALADNAAEVKDPERLTELVRQRLSRQLTQKHRSPEGELPALVLSTELESAFRRMQGSAGAGPVDSQDLSRVLSAFESASALSARGSVTPVVLTPADVRRTVATFASRHMPGVGVLSFRELDPSAVVKNLGVIGGPVSRGERRVE